MSQSSINQYIKQNKFSKSIKSVLIKKLFSFQKLLKKFTEVLFFLDRQFPSAYSRNLLDISKSVSRTFYQKLRDQDSKELKGNFIFSYLKAGRALVHFSESMETRSSQEISESRRKKQQNEIPNGGKTAASSSSDDPEIVPPPLPKTPRPLTKGVHPGTKTVQTEPFPKTAQGQPLPRAVQSVPKAMQPAQRVPKSIPPVDTSLTDIILQWKRRIDGLEEEKAVLIQQVSNMLTQINGLTLKTELQKNEEEESTRQIQTLKEKITMLELKNEALELLNESPDQETITQLHSKIYQEQETITILKQKICEDEKTIEDLTNKNHQLHAEFLHTRNEREELIIQLTSKEQVIMSLQGTKTEYQELMNKYEQDIHSLTSQIEHQHVQFSEFKVKELKIQKSIIQEFTQKLNFSDSELCSNIVTIETLNRTIRDQEIALNSFKQLNGLNQNLENKLSSTLNENRALNRKINEQTKTIQTLKEKKSEGQNNQTITNQIETMKRELFMTNQLNQNLIQEINTLKQTNSVQERNSQEIITLKEKNEANRNEIRGHSRKINELQRKIKDQEEKLTEQNDHKEKMKVESQSLNRKINQQQELIVILNQQEEQIASLYQKLTKEIVDKEKMKVERQGLNRKIAKLQKKIKELEEAKSILKSQNCDFR